MGRDRKNQSADLPPDSQALLRLIVEGCLKAQGLPSGPRQVAGAIELIDAGLAVVRCHGDEYWIEATDG